jgi:large subunit ribosomal protein L18
MSLQKDLKARRKRRKASIRRHVYGTSEKLRLSVYKSGVHIYAQIINDDESRTICSSSTIDKDVKGQLSDDMNKSAQSKVVGKILAERASEAGVEKVVFDRNGFLFTGRIKALADSAREAGLKF